VKWWRNSQNSQLLGAQSISTVDELFDFASLAMVVARGLDASVLVQRYIKTGAGTFTTIRTALTNIGGREIFYEDTNGSTYASMLLMPKESIVLISHDGQSASANVLSDDATEHTAIKAALVGVIT
jgi:hypothetical protein